MPEQITSDDIPAKFPPAKAGDTVSFEMGAFTCTLFVVGKSDTGNLILECTTGNLARLMWIFDNAETKLG